MEESQLQVLETLSLIYEDLDLDKVEEKFINLVDNYFDFDRVALFFVKHKKSVLQGKLGRRFSPERISSLEIPLREDYIFISPLINGLPYWHEKGVNDRFTVKLGLENYVLIPVDNKKRVTCWEIKDCPVTDCPAHGKKWLRCWLVSGTMCCEGQTISAAEKKERCRNCSIYLDQSLESVEGILLVDNSLTDRLISHEAVTILTLIAHAVGRAIDNSKLYRKTLHEALRDELTGLYNRRFFNERLLDEIERSRRYDEGISLLFGDIDHFKIINDSHGHPAGDTVLREIGKLMRTRSRKSDVAARYGGEEFSMILMNTTEDEAWEIADKLRTAVENSTFFHEGAPLRVTMSFGVATLDIRNDSFDEILKKADRALYKAKAAGRNQVCLA